MTVAQTAERETLYHRILELPDEDFGLVKQYVDDLEAHEPNEETIAAIKESHDPANRIGPFHSVEDLMASLLANDDA